MTHLRLLSHPFCIADAPSAAAVTPRQLLVVGHVVVDAEPVFQQGERTRDVTAGGRRGVLVTDGQRGRATSDAVSPPETVEAPGPPVDVGVVDDGGQDGVFVCEGGGEGPRFVSVGDLEDQTLVEAVVVVVDLVPVVLRG